MQYGLDMLYPPSVRQAQTMRMQGWSWLAVYVGGPRAASHNAWQQVDGARYPVRDLMPIFDGFLPIYVGRNYPWDTGAAYSEDTGLQDGEEACRLTGACGFDYWTPLVLDMEYGTYQNNPAGARAYIAGWVDAVNTEGHPAGIYSDIYTLGQIPEGQLIDFKWGAAWVNGAFSQAAPEGRFDPATPPPWQLWQFATGNIAGVPVDCNSLVDDFRLATWG